MGGNHTPLFSLRLNLFPLRGQSFRDLRPMRDRQEFEARRVARITSHSRTLNSLTMGIKERLLLLYLIINKHTQHSYIRTPHTNFHTSRLHEQRFKSNIALPSFHPHGCYTYQPRLTFKNKHPYMLSLPTSSHKATRASQHRPTNTSFPIIDYVRPKCDCHGCQQAPR